MGFPCYSLLFKKVREEGGRLFDIMEEGGCLFGGRWLLEPLGANLRKYSI